METKICCKCKKEKNVFEFTKNKNKKDKLSDECRSCRKEYKANYFKLGKAISRNRNNNLKGQCQHCKEKRLSTSKYCLYHFIYSLIHPWKLPKGKTVEVIQGLIIKLEASEYCCHYSGLKITPGFSASIDHRVPRAKGGSHDLSNLVWCHTQINKLKKDYSEKEFINRSANILVELNYLDSKGQL